MRLTRPRETEASFMRAVCELTALGGWRVYHGYLSIRSAPGWPDLLLVKPGQPVIYAELKLDGKLLTPAQSDWLTADWPAIAARLLLTPAPDTIKSFSRTQPC